MLPFSRILFVPLMLLALGGCKLIDQTTFAPELESEQSTVAASIPSRPTSQTALITIRYDTPAPAFRDQLAFAVRSVEQRRPGGQYEVVGVSSTADATQTGRDSAAVMEGMVKLGVNDTRIGLGARIDPAQAVREVRVYLR